MKIVTAAQMQDIDRRCADMGLPTQVLMENAGRAVAEEVRHILGSSENKRIVFLIGPGNNGGDGLVAGRYLQNWGAIVSLYLCTRRPSGDVNLKLAEERGVSIISREQDENLSLLDSLLSCADAAVDAIFGTGSVRSLAGTIGDMLSRVSKVKETRPEIRIIALDLPSGLNADNGQVDLFCLSADNTITLGFPKVGLFNPPGTERAGNITVADIGIPAGLGQDIAIELITGHWVKSVLPRRSSHANKGSFGKVLVIAGSHNYIGAAYLACSGAIRVGAGLVTLATRSSLTPVIAGKVSEVTHIPLPESQGELVPVEAAVIISERLTEYNALLIGCGLGQSPAAMDFIWRVLFESKTPLPPVVLDADALNTLAKVPEWWQKLKGQVILTPHPGEMSRLAEIPVDEIQSDRAGVVSRSARQWQQTIVLKGAYTVTGTPDGRVKINPAANAGLASAGTGDVLAGVIAGLLAQGLATADASACGVYLHGATGDAVRSELGDAGMIASDLLPVLPRTIKGIKEIRGPVRFPFRL